MKPTVTVLLLTHNYERCIRKCIDSILCQKTQYPFKVLAFDDASEDGTAGILAEYAAKHPNVEVTVRPRNLGLEGNTALAYDTVDSDYFIICDGDDYWTDEHKLELQVSALERHPECSICVHRVRVSDAEGKTLYFMGPEPRKEETVFEFRRAPFSHTTARMFRNFLKDMKPADRHFIWLDTFVHFYALDRGNMVYLNRTMSTYVYSGAGIWSSRTEEEQRRSNRLEAFQIDQFLGFRHTDYFRKRYLPERPGKLFSFTLPFFGKRKLRFTLDRTRPLR